MSSRSSGASRSGYFFVLIPLLTVPSPANYLFYLAWLVPIGLSLLWWRSHPWRGLAVAAIATVLVIAAISVGSAIFGWAP